MRLCPRCNTPYSNSTATCPRDGEVLSTLPQVMTELRVPQPIIPGSIVGNYQIIKKLGSGGMGAVYSATHLSLGKEVAIKILREDSAQNPKMLDRFYREARALAKIEHDNIIKTSDFGCTPEGLTYLVMELLSYPKEQRAIIVEIAQRYALPFFVLGETAGDTLSISGLGRVLGNFPIAQLKARFEGGFEAALR